MEGALLKLGVNVSELIMQTGGKIDDELVQWLRRHGEAHHSALARNPMGNEDDGETQCHVIHITIMRLFPF